MKKCQNHLLNRCHCCPAQNNHKENGFYGKIQAKFKQPLRPPGRRPAWPGHGLCVFLCITSLKRSENPIDLDIIFKEIICKYKFPHFLTWIPDSRPFQPVPERKFLVESEFEVKNQQIRRPGAKTYGKRPQKTYFFIRFFFSFFFSQVGDLCQGKWVAIILPPALRHDSPGRSCVSFPCTRL